MAARRLRKGFGASQNKLVGPPLTFTLALATEPCRDTSAPVWHGHRKSPRARPSQFLDRDFAGEAVIGAIEANDLGDQALYERRSLGEDVLHNVFCRSKVTT